MGADYCLIGHSERRTLFAETDEFIAKKIQAAIENDLCPMLCVGETLSQRESQQTKQILAKQLKTALHQFPKNKKLIVAYEPVWAIGTGKVATPEMAEETHQFVRELISEILGSTEGQNTLWGQC